MSLSVHQMSAPIFVRALKALDALLSKGEAHVAATGGNLQDLFDARLAPDMYTLAGQIQRSSDASKLAVVRLTGVEAPVFEDTEATFEELHARIAKTIAFIEGVDASAFEGAETREVVLKFPNGQMEFAGADFLAQFALPNFYFHVTAAYAILRNAGAPIGKRDFLGG